MIDSLCPLCGSLQSFDGSWLACACDTNPSRTLTVRQAARYLYMSPSGVYHLINDGWLAAIRDSHPLQVRLIVLKLFKIDQHIGRSSCGSQEQGSH